MKCELCGEQIRQEWHLRSFVTWHVDQPSPICTSCQDNFIPIVGRVCHECGVPNDAAICQECEQWLAYGVQPLNNQALFRYDETMKRYFELYKFKGGYHLRQAFTKQLATRLAKVSADMIVPIPITSQTKARRGFNQVSGLLEKCETRDVLTCISSTKAVQSMKTRRERLQTTQPFKMQSKNIDLSGQRICLIDDIYTTGRTLRHAAQCLYESGATQVCSITLAR